MDVSSVVPWATGVVTEGVRANFYLENALWKEKLQSEVMPELLKTGVVAPNRQKFVQGDSMLERAEKALGLLRAREVRGERAVWRVSDLPEGEWERR